MRRAHWSASRSVPLLCSALLLLSLWLGSLAARAQEATPVTEAPPVTEDEIVAGPDGIGFAFLGGAATNALPANPATLNLLRFTFAPRSGFALSPDDPATGFLYVETGTLSFRVDAPMIIFRAAATPAVPGEVDQVAPGEVFTMSRGDATVFPPSIPGETRNLSDEPASVLVLNIVPVDAPPTADADSDAGTSEPPPADAAATPMP